MENNIRKYLIEFDFNYLDKVDSVLNNAWVLRKTFEKNVSYLIVLEEDKYLQILNLLLIVTFNQIKIHDLNKVEELQEVGTDKPIGSKSAIDEN